MKTLMSATLSIVLLFPSIVLAAQPRAYLEMSPGFWSGPATLKIDGKTIPRRALIPGYSFSQTMGNNKRALELAQKHETYAMWSGISAGVALAGALTYLAVTDSDDYESSTYFAIFFVGLLPSLVLQKTAMAYLLGAINAYNGIDDRYESRFDFSAGPLKDGAAAGITYSF